MTIQLSLSGPGVRDFSMTRKRLSQLSHRVVPQPVLISCTDPDPVETEKEPYTIAEQPLGTIKHVRIVGIGAGASGINMIRTLRKHVTNYEHVIYEKNDDVGGTWLENRYPGCRCDVPSHNYQFSWAQNKEWSNFFSTANEIREYLCRVCRQENMMDLIKTRHRVKGARWDEASGLWNISVENLETGDEFRDQANFVIDASGVLNNWKWPDVPGLHSFQGRLIHTASWPEDFDHRGKTVAVIGNGSSGVQLVPTIQPEVKRLYHFVRTPTWIIPPRLQVMRMLGSPAAKVLDQIELDDDENFTQRQIDKFKAQPESYRDFVRAMEVDMNGQFSLILNDSNIKPALVQMVKRFMMDSLCGDEKLCKALIPTFPLGVRRITPAPGYLESLRADNVDVFTDEIGRFVAEGIQLKSGEVIKLDAVVCATGFDNSFAPRFPLLGRAGNVQDQMRADTPKGYMSCALAGLPNYFTFFGPNGPIGHGSVFTLSEHIARYISNIIVKCQTEGIKAIAPSQAAVDDYSEHIESFMPRTAWAAPGRSWFKGGRETGPVTALHPGSRMHFFHMLERFRGEDWEYVYDSASSRNRFAYLGNGFSTKELDPSLDPTWYLDALAADTS